MSNDIRDNVECILLEYCDTDIPFDTWRTSTLNRAHFCEHRRRPGRFSPPKQCADRLVAYVNELLKENEDNVN